jgi:plastocyanin
MEPDEPTVAGNPFRGAIRREPVRNGQEYLVRKLCTILAASALALALLGVAPAAAKTSKPVTLAGKVNNKGTKDISSKTTAKLELEADDFYFSPTFVKVKPGEKVTITLKNEGDATHTFTSDALSIDQQVSAGKSKKFTVTVPSSDTAFQFHCDFHESMGMQGAFYTKPGATLSSASSTATTAPSAAASMGY